MCDEDYDGCANRPCLTGTECFDLTPEEQVAAGKAFNCSSCPEGYAEDFTDFNCIGELTDIERSLTSLNSPAWTAYAFTLIFQTLMNAIPLTWDTMYVTKVVETLLDHTCVPAILGTGWMRIQPVMVGSLSEKLWEILWVSKACLDFFPNRYWWMLRRNKWLPTGVQ